MHKLIGLCGDIGAGKSSAGRIFRLCGYKIHPLAEPLKQMLMALGLSEEDVNGYGKELPHPLLLGKTPRKALQLLGTEWGRNLIGDEVWLNVWNERRSMSPLVVVDDVRFQNEFDYLKDRGAHIIRIVRPGITKSKHTHASEQAHASFECDDIIFNSGTYRDLQDQVSGLIKQFA